jgi:hypothetical protein
MEKLKVKGEKVMKKNDVATEKNGVATEKTAVKKNVTLGQEQSQKWDAYRETQIQALLADALDRLNEPIAKTILRYGIARNIDQKHNAAERKVRAYEAGKALNLDTLFSKVRSGSKDELASTAVDLLIEASAVDKDRAKAIMAVARKVNTIVSWENAIAEFEDILGQ